MRYACHQAAILSLLVSVLAFATEQSTAQPSREQIQAWRAEGPAAVDRLMKERERLIAEAEKVPRKKEYTLADDYVVQNEAERAAWKRVYAINDTIDAVAAAKYSHESGLYWYTDEEEAMRVAKEQGKPVLYLRLLGNLNEELSCANSRYFRILLYPDEAVRKLLHDKFVLVWKSERPVPKITVDFGDGRKVERTITGNSVHYVLLPSGQVVDVFPGLYGPKPFSQRLEKAAAVSVQSLNSAEPDLVLTQHRNEQLAELERTWTADWKRYVELQQQPQVPAKMIDVGYAPTPSRDFWTAIADFHPEYAELGISSRDLIKHEAVVGFYGLEAEHLVATKHGERIIPVSPFIKGGDESIMRRLLGCVTTSLKADTLSNEYQGRYTALLWLKFSPDKPIEDLNREVYQTIFGYDPDDPWAGLANLDSLTGLPKDRGLVESRQKPAAAER